MAFNNARNLRLGTDLRQGYKSFADRKSDANVRVVKVSDKGDVHGHIFLRDRADSIGYFLPNRQLKASPASGDSGAGTLAS